MTEATMIPITHIERKPDSDYYRIIGKGVTVEFLSTLINGPEWTVERICENYGLTPAEVYSAWAFFYDHQTEIEARLASAAQRQLEAEQPAHHIKLNAQRKG